MNTHEAVQIMAILSTATGQHWDQARLSLWSSLLVKSGVSHNAAAGALDVLLATTDPRKIFPGMLIEQARKLSPVTRPPLEEPTADDDVTMEQALEGLKRHPRVHAAMKSLWEKHQALKGTPEHAAKMREGLASLYGELGRKSPS